MSCPNCGNHKYCRNISMVHILYKTILVDKFPAKKLVTSGFKDHNLVRIFTGRYLAEDPNWSDLK